MRICEHLHTIYFSYDAKRCVEKCVRCGATRVLVRNGDGLRKIMLADSFWSKSKNNVTTNSSH